jgi:hypothetical protein
MVGVFPATRGDWGGEPQCRCGERGVPEQVSPGDAGYWLLAIGYWLLLSDEVDQWLESANS